MKNKHALSRYRLIDNRMTMKQKPAPTLQDLVDFVSEKMNAPISVASIQKDIYAMRYDESLGFNAPIEYSKAEKAYRYTDPSFSISNIPVSEEDLHGLEIAIGILEQFKDIPAIRVFEDAITKIAASVKQSRAKVSEGKIVLLDRPKRYLGIEYMADMVDAIHNRNVLRIQYQPFTKKEAAKHTVHPYFIKEYNGRMYLIGKDIHPVKESKFLTFAFDRMSSVIKMNQTFIEEQVDKENYFKETIGISQPGTKPEKIVLQFDPAQANYLKSQPIHHSQEILKDNAKVFSIGLELVINYELKSLLLGFGDKMKVLKPQSLVLDMQQSIQAMQALYES
ncbi:MAG: WYL domain-containing protein [Bacteroidetes bacterium]|nr:WYL domain-containing protein [Bacteroidota bacterium]